MAGIRFCMFVIALAFLPAAAGWGQECPALAGDFMEAGTPCGFAIFKSTALVTQCSDLVQVLDIAGASSVRQLWSASFSSLCPTQTIVEGAAWSNRYGYFTFRCSPDASSSPAPTGLLVLDFSNPASPTEHPRVEAVRPATAGYTGVLVSGGAAFVSAGTEGLYVYDLADPSHPVELAHLQTEGYAEALAMIDNFVILVDRSLHGLEGEGIVVVDVNKPDTPKKVGTFSLTGDPRRIVLEGLRAYVTDCGNPAGGAPPGLWTLDFSHPAQPQSLGFYETQQRAFSVASSGKLAFVSLEAEGSLRPGLAVLNVSDPAKVSQVGFAQIYGNPGGLAYHNHLIYLGAPKHLKIYDPSACSTSSHTRPVTPP